MRLQIRRHHVVSAASAVVAEALLLCAAARPAAGQVVLDGKLGSTPSLGHGGNYVIPAGVGHRDGVNLFHSFSRFDVPQGGSATFIAPPTTANILARVTGGAASHIEGRIATRVEDPSDPARPSNVLHPANLYLMNPAGVVFGEGASLDVGGSFAVTTADYVRLSDGTQFNASPGAEPVLRTSLPAAFGFARNNPAGISINGATLETQGASVLSVVGGPVRIRNGRLSVGPGRVNVVAAGRGEVRLDSADPNSAVDASGLVERADVELSNSTVSTFVQFDDPFDDDGRTGRVEVLARNVSMAKSHVSSDADELFLFDDTSARAAGAVSLDLSGTLLMTEGSSISADVSGFGQAGRVTVTAGEIDIRDSGVSADGIFDSAGIGGSVYLDARDKLSLAGASVTATGNDAAGGAVHLTAGSMELTDFFVNAGVEGGGRGTTSGFGGAVVVTAAGNLMARSGQFFSDSTWVGGSVSLDVTRGDLQLDDVNVFADGEAGAGPIKVSVPKGELTARNGTVISSTVGDSIEGASGSTSADLLVSARSFTMEGSDVFTKGEFEATSGDVKVNVADALVLRDSRIRTMAGTASGSGRLKVTAGNISMDGSAIAVEHSTSMGSLGLKVETTSGPLVARNGSRISSNAASDVIEVDAAELDFDSSFIATSSSSGSGSIHVHTSGDFSLVNGGVLAQDGAAIRIEANHFLADAALVRRDVEPFGRLEGASPEIAIQCTGDFTLRNGATIESVGLVGTPGAPVRVSGRNVLIDGGGAAARTGIFLDGPLDVAPGTPNVSVTAADTLRVLDGAGIEANTFSETAAGMVRLAAGGDVELRGARVVADSFRSGGGGRIELSAGGTLLLDAATRVSARNYRAGGTPGAVDLTARSVSLASGSSVSTAGGGAPAGDVKVHLDLDADALGPGESAEVTLVSPIGTRVSVLKLANTFDGFPLSIDQTLSDDDVPDPDTGNLNLTRTGFLSRFLRDDVNGRWTILVTNAAGRAVNLRGWSIEFNGRRFVSSDSAPPGGNIRSTVAVATDPGASAGAGGDVRVKAESVAIGGNSSLSSGTIGSGPAGNLRLDVGSLVLDAGRVESSSDSAGNAGSITVAASGPVRLDNGSVVSVAAPAATGGAIDIAAGAGVEMNASQVSADALRAGRVTLTAPSVALSDSSVSSDTVENGTAGPSDVTVRTSSLQLEHSELFARSSGPGVGGSIQVVGPAGAAPSVRLSGGSDVSASTTDTGKGGSVFFDADELAVEDSTVRSATTGTADAGKVTLSARGDLVLRNATLRTSADRAGGNDILVQSLSHVDVSGGEITATAAGNGGSVTLSGPDGVTLAGGARVSAETRGAAAGSVGGAIELTSTRSVRLADTTVAASASGGGTGGTVTIHGAAANGGERPDVSVIDSRVTTAAADGAGGTIEVEAARLSLDRTAVESTTSGLANAGGITLDASRSVFLGDATSVNVAATNADAGSVRIRAGDSIDVAGSRAALTRITAEAKSGKAGNIELKAATRVSLANSRVSAESHDRGGAQITIDPELVLLNRTEINGLAAGTDVPVKLVARTYIRSSDSVIRSNQVSTPVEVDLAGGLSRLPDALLHTSARLQQSCGIRFGGDVSSFVVTGQGGTGPTPDGWAPDFGLIGIEEEAAR